MSDGAHARGPHGWLVVDKPRGITSAAAVARIKSLVGRGSKVGHAGTLDPMATGVLPVAIGEATKTVSFMMDAPKRYRFGVRWGEQRDTDDAEGAVIETSESRPSREAVANALSGLYRPHRAGAAGILGPQGRRGARLCARAPRQSARAGAAHGPYREPDADRGR